MNESKIGNILRKELHKDEPLERVVKLHGDASYRTYSRAYLSDGSTFIIMQMPEGKSSASEEITNFKGRQDELPFISVERYLRGLGLNTPAIYRYDEKDRMMVIEDLGDVLMSTKLEDADRPERVALYKKAIDVLLTLQSESSKKKDACCVALKRSFDAVLLNWEFDHFLEYGIEARLGVKIADSDRDVFRRETRAITDEINAMSYGFTHRDFQSRNLVIKDGKFYVIDFQDALLGPKAYDLVALLRDSYFKLDDDELNELLSYYSSKSGYEAKSLRRDFALVTIQRKLKDAGRFVYIDRVKGNPNFLAFIGVSLSYVKDAFASLSTHRGLFEMLTRYVPEWGGVKKG
jgi:aminoglycoside/choline kinase family phosphotransferase